MKIRVIKSFGGYKAGQEFEWGDGMARLLIARGLIVELDEVEEATVSTKAAERAVQPQPQRKQR